MSCQLKKREPLLFMNRTITPGSLISMKEAQRLILSTCKSQPRSKLQSVMKSAGLILADQVVAPRSVPPVPLAGIDGVAVRSRDTKGASADDPKEVPGTPVNLGLPLPDGKNAIVPYDKLRQTEDSRFQVESPVSQWEQVIAKGSDVLKDQVIFQRDHLLTPYDCAALSHFGVKSVLVKTWKIGIIATGDEIVPAKKDPGPGEIVDSNTSMISGYLQGFGVAIEVFPITPDDSNLISARVLSACDSCDLVLVFGGTSAGTKDTTVRAFSDAGTLLFHGVAIEPGGTVSCGKVLDKPVFGIPGNPASCLISFFQFVFPLLKSWGIPIPPKKHVIGELSTDIIQTGKCDRFFLVKTRYDDGIIRIIPLEWRFGYSPGIEADGILHLPDWSGGYHAGEKVQVTLIR